jgi:hypothetical protein
MMRYAAPGRNMMYNGRYLLSFFTAALLSVDLLSPGLFLCLMILYFARRIEIYNNSDFKIAQYRLIFWGGLYKTAREEVRPTRQGRHELG